MGQGNGSSAGYQLIAFDVDGTLVGNDEGKVVWELLNRHFCGCDKVNEERYARYRAGSITYEQWVELDVGDWIRAGATRADMRSVIGAHLYPIAHAEELLDQLAEAGFRLAVISGTLDVTLDLLFPRHPFEAVHTNKIFFDDAGRISGWEATPYDMEGKARALETLAETMGIPLCKTVFVGDNINDTYVMRRAGLAVAFEPKADEVAAAADVVISDLLEVLSLASTEPRC